MRQGRNALLVFLILRFTFSPRRPPYRKIVLNLEMELWRGQCRGFSHSGILSKREGKRERGRDQPT